MATFPKILLLCCTLVALSLGDRDREFLEECLQDVNLTEEELMKFTGNVATDKYMCYLKCVNMKKGVLDSDGNINVEMLEMVSGEYKLPKKALAAFLDCVGEIGPIQKCKDMNKIIKCYDDLDSY